MKKYVVIIWMVMLSLSMGAHLQAGTYYTIKKLSIKNAQGKLYAYIVLLYNENPHFINLIQKDTIPLSVIGNEGFHLREYKRYLHHLSPGSTKNLASLLLSIYLNPNRYTDSYLLRVEHLLERQNIVLKFSRNSHSNIRNIALDYCIYAKKELVTVKHPFFQTHDTIYNIQPHIYYDEFSTSNSTFYYDMIYINPEEVQNDYLIAKKILVNQDVSKYYFNGSPVNNDIIFCLKQAFINKKHIRKEIQKIFYIHELSHKSIHNDYHNYDQVTGEEVSLSSTIYVNPYLGLAILYSYLNYNAINPHRIAAMNYIQFVSKALQKPEIIDNPSLLKDLDSSLLKSITKDHFYSLTSRLKLVKAR